MITEYPYEYVDYLLSKIDKSNKDYNQLADYTLSILEKYWKPEDFKCFICIIKNENGNEQETIKSN